MKKVDWQLMVSIVTRRIFDPKGGQVVIRGMALRIIGSSPKDDWLITNALFEQDWPDFIHEHVLEIAVTHPRSNA